MENKWQMARKLSWIHWYSMFCFCSILFFYVSEKMVVGFTIVSLVFD